MLTSSLARRASNLASQGTVSQPGKAVVVSIKIKISFRSQPKPKQVRISVDGDSVELPTNSEGVHPGGPTGAVWQHCRQHRRGHLLWC